MTERKQLWAGGLAFIYLVAIALSLWWLNQIKNQVRAQTEATQQQIATRRSQSNQRRSDERLAEQALEMEQRLLPFEELPRAFLSMLRRGEELSGAVIGDIHFSSNRAEGDVKRQIVLVNATVPSEEGLLQLLVWVADWPHLGYTGNMEITPGPSEYRVRLQYLLFSTADPNRTPPQPATAPPPQLVTPP